MEGDDCAESGGGGSQELVVKGEQFGESKNADQCPAVGGEDSTPTDVEECVEKEVDGLLGSDQHHVTNQAGTEVEGGQQRGSTKR